MGDAMKAESGLEELSGIIVKAMTYADGDPETALMHARKSAEAICTSIFSREIGDPGKNRLDKLIELLSNSGKIPERITIPLRVIQQYGNYGSHFQSDGQAIDRSYIDPCLSALVQVTNWFIIEYLHAQMPQSVTAANNDFSPQEQVSSTPGLEEDPAQLSEQLGLVAPLRTYQWEGVSFLARNEAALLADEMGLGKTVQTIVALRLLLRKSYSFRALLVVPNSLAPNWEREVRTWAPDLVVRRVLGTSEDRLATYQLPVQVLIATYDQVRADAINIDQDVHFELLVLDEAQRIKNRDSRVALACRFLRRSRAWVLTGTPLENSVEDLVSLFVLLLPGLVDSGMAPAEIRRRIKPHFLRRRKRDVLAEMPPIILQDMTLELAGAQERAYVDLWMSRHDQVRQDGGPISDIALLAMLTKLKQLCNYEPVSGESVKMEALQVILDDCCELEDKVLIFSQYVETLHFISRQLGAYPHELYIGEQTIEEREAALSRFRSRLGPKVMLMSLRAGGVGLNIQEASIVVLFDRWWNPAVESQAVQRAHRFGRERPLHVVRFVVADTIEERIVEVLRDKEADFEQYIENAENATIRKFTREEIRRILELTVDETDRSKNEAQ
jgi:SNF2 family DNA or RNA helicase